MAESVSSQPLKPAVEGKAKAPSIPFSFGMTDDGNLVRNLGKSVGVGDTLRQKFTLGGGVRGASGLSTAARQVERCEFMAAPLL